MRGAWTLAGSAVALLAGCAAAPDEVEDAPVAGPLSAYLWEYAEHAMASDHERAVAADEETAACMKEQGFDYTPSPEGAWSSSLSTASQDGDWVAEHGYGIADQANVETSDAPPDPNAAALAAMSAPEQQAWEAALRDCGSVEASAWWADEGYQHWQEESVALEAVAEEDPDVDAARVTWSGCMADAGHPGLASPLDAWQSARDLAVAAGVDDPDGIPEARRADVLAAEIAVATADRECDEAAGLGRTRAATVERLQGEFVDEHRAELDAWRATWAG